MPRVSPRGSHPPKKPFRVVSSRSRKAKIPPEERAALLESQLASVIDQRSTPGESIPVKKTDVSAPTHVPVDVVRGMDTKILSSLQKKSSQNLRKPVRIRFEKHEPSAYLLHAPTQVKKYAPPTRLSEEATIRQWVAPFEIPPSLDRLVSEAKDLHVASVDPRVFAEQFTPADPDVAYRNQFGFLAKLKRPFFRWEVVFVSRVPVSRHSFQASSDTAPIQIDVASLREEQFTNEQDGREEHEEAPLQDVPASEPVLPARPVWYKRLFSWIRRSEKMVAKDVKELAHEAKDREEELIVQTEEAWGVPMVVPKLVPYRVVIGLFGLLAVVSLPAGAVSLSRSFGASYDQIRSRGTAAVADVQDALHRSQGDAPSAWLQASTRFQEADRALSQVNVVALALAQALPQTRDRLQSAHGLLQAGDKAAQAARLLSQGLNQSLSQPVTHTDERLQILMTYLDAAAPVLQQAQASLGDVSVEQLPADLRPQISQVQDALSLGEGSLKDLRAISQFALAALGHDRPRTYLFLFQNQTELRPTGGFMGSFAEVVFDRGDMKRLTVPGGGPYDLQNQLRVRVLPPKPLQLVTSRWEFQDANWFPDFPTAAKKIRWFWSKAGQPTLDGVVAINASVLQKLLTVTGPIEMPEYGKTITADNVLLETQKSVELEYDKTENKPKKFIGDLLPKVLEKMRGASQQDLVRYAGVMAEALQTKDIQIAMTDEEEEGAIEGWGWNGRMVPTPGDALAVVEANIAGQKTDGVIDERVSHVASIQEDGSIIDTVTLERAHNGQAGELFRGANNVAYVRVYVPQGSELISASGFQPPAAHYFQEILENDPVDPDIANLIQREYRDTSSSVVVTDEFDRTAFGGWVQLSPGAHSTTTFQYRLPFTAQDLAQKVASGTADGVGKAAYLLLLTSQSGKSNRVITSSLRVPETWRESWSHTPFTSSTQLLWDRDQVVANLFETSHVETP